MDFDRFINKPIREIDLVVRLAGQLRREFDEHKDKCYFLKLEKMSEELSYIKHVEMYKRDVQRSPRGWLLRFIAWRIAITFVDDHYEIYFAGFSTSFFMDVFVDRLEFRYQNYDNEHMVRPNVDETKPLNIAEGFADLHDYFNMLKKLGAI